MLAGVSQSGNHIRSVARISGENICQVFTFLSSKWHLPPLPSHWHQCHLCRWIWTSGEGSKDHHENQWSCEMLPAIATRILFFFPPLYFSVDGYACISNRISPKSLMIKGNISTYWRSKHVKASFVSLPGVFAFQLSLFKYIVSNLKMCFSFSTVME